MIPGGAFVEELKEHGYDFFTTVPCSILKGVIRVLENEPRDRFISAVREDAACGFACGAWMGGRQPVVLCQNSGFSVSINAIASLMRMNRIPCLFIVSWRGYQGVDAPEHLITGAIMLDQMKLVGVPYEVLEPERMGEQIATLTMTMEETREPVALVVRPGRIGS
jgi:sulfopyruvate decarboxylase alpha subunit